MIQRPEAHKARAACDAGKATKEAAAEKKGLLAMRCTYAGGGLHAFVLLHAPSTSMHGNWV